MNIILPNGMELDKIGRCFYMDGEPYVNSNLYFKSKVWRFK